VNRIPTASTRDRVAYNASTMNRSRPDATAALTPSRPDIITDRFLATLRQHGVVQASLFGSVTRGEERPDSDLDLLVTFDHGGSFGERLRLEEALAALCGRRVEVLTQIHPAFAPYITPTLIPLPL